MSAIERVERWLSVGGDNLPYVGFEEDLRELFTLARNGVDAVVEGRCPCSGCRARDRERLTGGDVGGNIPKEEENAYSLAALPHQEREL